jgi:hypothetical protein
VGAFEALILESASAKTRLLRLLSRHYRKSISDCQAHILTATWLDLFIVIDGRWFGLTGKTSANGRVLARQ